MFEIFTAYLPGLQSEGSSYYRAIPELTQAIGQFAKDHNEEMGLYHYQEILEAAGIRWEFDSMADADVSSLDGKTVAALLLGAVRAERFSDCIFRFLSALSDRYRILRKDFPGACTRTVLGFGVH